MSPRSLLSALALVLLVPGAAAAADADHQPAAGAASVPAPTVKPASVQAGPDSTRYVAGITRNNLIGVTLSNYGFVGNNFNSSSPSLEYPLGSANEHLTRSGLWVGAQAIDDQGAFIGVTTATVDGSAGTSSQAGTEWTPAGLDFMRRSSLESSDKFDKHAVSEDDWVSFFSDNPARKFSGENHRPLNILVRQTNYNWSFADYAHMMFFHYVVTNLGLPLSNVWVGFYSELASGLRTDYFSWPPSQVNSKVGSWYSKKWVQYDDSLYFFREHYCARLPVPVYCDAGHVPEWVGWKVLGATPGRICNPEDPTSCDTSLHVTMASWAYAPGSPLRNTDVLRYGIMSSGQVQDLSGADFQPETGDPVELLAVGPFKELDPGDSVSFDIAFIGGAMAAGADEIQNIHRRAHIAQKAYDLDYVVPVPPPSPRLKIVAHEQAIDYYWDDSPEHFKDPTADPQEDFEGYRIYLGTDRLDLKLIGQYDLATAPGHDTTGFNTGLAAIKLATPVTIDGVTYSYKYTVKGLRDGFKYFTAVTSYDLGNAEIESLESGVTQNKTMAIPGPAPGETVAGNKTIVFPNPYRVEARWDAGQRVRDHYLWFTNLPERCTLRIYTLSGDLVFQTDFDGRTYAGEGARGVYSSSRELDVKPPTLAGTSYAWDMITRQGQAAATGLYMFSVEDKTGTRGRDVGKFLIVKSDRE